MGKKRKARAQPTQSNGETANYDPHNDSEDEFAAARDRVLLDEGPAAKRRRRLEEDDAELMPSDEEVLGIADQSEEEGEDADDISADEQVAAASEDEEDEAYWGANRADYYGADAIEEEQDALDEENEARRLQHKQLQGMTEADFGFNELEWKQEEAQKSGTGSVEKLPPLRVSESATNEERLQILKNRYPEFEPLSEDLLDCHEEYQELQKVVSTQGQRKAKPSAQQVRFWAVSAYMSAIAMYMAVLTSPKDGIALPPSELRKHPIMTSLVRARQLWESTNELESDIEDEEDSAVETALPSKTVQPVQLISTTSGTLLPQKLKAIAEEPQKKSKKAKATIEPEPALPTTSKASKKAKTKSDKPKRATLEELLASSVPTADDSASDFGDETPLTASEAAAKDLKRKSLRFYTSQITAKSNKRSSASRHAGGDDDLPYKERIRDRQERTAREVANERNRAPSIEANGDSDAEYDENDLAKTMNNDANAYYNTLVSATTAKKSDKLARAEAHAQAAAQGAQVYEEETVGPDGKRKITYAIEKNKGLQPRRKKDVRNPRVKKKKKYAEKQKKLASMKPVWKGGLKGTYAGEASGIKGNVVKSVKL